MLDITDVRTSDQELLKDLTSRSKELYDFLRHLSSRYVNKPVFTSYNDKITSKKRSYVAPYEFYSFSFFDKKVEIRKRSEVFFVASLGFCSYTQKSEVCFDGYFRYCSSKSFTEAKEVFLRIVSELIDRYFKGDFR